MTAEPSPASGDTHKATPLSLLERLRANDPAAWQRCVTLYQPLVRFWCGHGGLRGPDAEDVAQEVFVAAAASLPRFRRDRPGDTFRGWLRGITRNQTLMHYRRGERHTPGMGGSAALEQLRDIPDPLAEPVAGEDVEMGEVYRRALEQVRGEFPQHVWQAFWRTTIDGRRAGDLTAELQMTVNHIRQAKSRVLRRLREEVGELFH